MCLIIYKPKKIKFTENIENNIKYSYRFNSDGMGIAILNNNKLYFDKTFNNLEELIKISKENSQNDIVIHLRKASQGEINIKMRHPFDIYNINKTKGESKLLLFHNGTINLGNNKISDTYELACIINYLVINNLFNNKYIKKMFKTILGTNRILLMSKKEIILYGKWYKENGVYYSNPHYKPVELKNIYYYNNIYNNYRNNYFNKKEVCDECKQKVSYTLYNKDFNKYLCWKCENKLLNNNNTTTKTDIFICDICNDYVENIYFYENAYLCKKCYNFFK